MPEDALGPQLHHLNALNPDDLELVTRFIDALVTKTRLKTLRHTCPRTVTSAQRPLAGQLRPNAETTENHKEPAESLQGSTTAISCCAGTEAASAGQTRAKPE